MTGTTNAGASDGAAGGDSALETGPSSSPFGTPTRVVLLETAEVARGAVAAGGCEERVRPFEGENVEGIVGSYRTAPL